MKQRVLFLCTDNSSRSQMAEGLLLHLTADRFDVFSAGTYPSLVNQLAIRVMDERGIDIYTHYTKPISAFLNQPFHFVITLCDHPSCEVPGFLNVKRQIYWELPDPAKAQGSETDQLMAFRVVRDTIEELLRHWLSEADT